MRGRLTALVIAATIAATASPALAQATQGIGVYGPGGWTVLRPSQDTRFIFVSSSEGDDNNNGLSPETAMRTIDAARRMVRNGYPDWVLLRRGDSWAEEFRWSGNGRTLEEPMVIGAYGDGNERPLLLTPANKEGFYIGTGSLRYLAITGLEFRAPEAGTGGTGIRIIANTGEGLLIEDCLLDGYKDNVSIIGQESQGGFNNAQVRRCVSADAASVGGAHAQGLYADAVNGLLVEGCVFDHNGWTETGTCPPTIFSHNIYIQSNCGPATVIDNIISRGSSHGLQLRPGGVAENNLLVRNALAMYTSRAESTIRRNVVLEGRDLDEANPRGFGIEIKPIEGGVVEQNIIAGRLATSPDGYAFRIDTSDNGVANFDVTIQNNVVYDWESVALEIRHPNLAIYDHIVVRDNQFVADGASKMVTYAPSVFDAGKFSFSSNNYVTGASASVWFRVGSNPLSFQQWKAQTNEWSASSSAPSFSHPDRNLESYYRDVIGESGGFDEFMARARRLSRGTWDDRFTAHAVNAYIRAGFDMAP